MPDPIILTVTIVVRPTNPILFPDAMFILHRLGLNLKCGNEFLPCAVFKEHISIAPKGDILRATSKCTHRRTQNRCSREGGLIRLQDSLIDKKRHLELSADHLDYRQLGKSDFFFIVALLRLCVAMLSSMVNESQQTFEQSLLHVQCWGRL